MHDDGETLLSELLFNSMDEADVRKPSPLPTVGPRPVEVQDETKQDKENHSQWALGGNGKFMPVGTTVTSLIPGIYEPFAVPGMWGLELTKVASDTIYALPDMATETVLNEVNRFWSSESRYRKHNLLYKRGIILWGPPGSGKSVTVKVLMNELIKQGGIVILAQKIELTIMCLKALRRIEPNRRLIVVFEDIDEIINYNGESNVLSMLDGENNVDNILNLATTNYPERLGARIINRPSRFDRRVFVGMPSPDARKVYFQKSTENGLDDSTLTKWVEDTNGMSIAHLRELVAAVYCLDQPYEDVVQRLKEMATPVKPVDGFKAAATVGFSAVSKW